MFAPFYQLLYLHKAHVELGSERAERQMFSLSPTSDQVISSRKYSRSGIIIHNEGPGTAYIGFGTEETSADNFSIKLPVDTDYSVHGHNRVFQGELRASADTANTLIMFTESRRVIVEAPTPRDVLQAGVPIKVAAEAEVQQLLN